MSYTVIIFLKMLGKRQNGQISVIKGRNSTLIFSLLVSKDEKRVMGMRGGRFWVIYLKFKILGWASIPVFNLVLS